MKTQKYRLLGMPLLAGALCLTGCGGSTDPKADVMEGEVQQPVRQEDSADSAYRADDDTVPEESSLNPVLPPLSVEAQTIDYKGSIPIDYLTASADAVYLVSRDQEGGSGILKMKPGETDGEALPVTAPDGMVFSLPHCQVNTSLFWIFVYYNMIVKAVDLLSSPSLIRRSPEYPLFKQSRAATTRNTSYGVLKPALLCSVLACCAAELQRIKPYLGLRWTEKINR